MEAEPSKECKSSRACTVTLCWDQFWFGVDMNAMQAGASQWKGEQAK